MGKSARLPFSVLLVVAILVLSQQWRDLARAIGHPVAALKIPYGGAILDNGVAVLIVLVAALLMLRGGGLFDRMGLRSNGWRGPVLVAVATIPAWVGLFMLGGLSHDWRWLDLAMLALAFPLAEEIVFRGFGFLFTHRALGWPLWLAVGVQALLFGLVHWWGMGGPAGGDMALQVLMITGIGGVVMALLDRLDGNTIWSGAVLHISLNAAWNVFTVPDEAIFGWTGNALRIGAAVLALLLVWGFGSGKRGRR
ncbi:membrane protease YdiL (CAAX protease family) [Sphingomonas kyeonggiensis]|uniref:Membrane protease YdiL (CAAX protease family) n=1 Tax=Sphingomonas kyeonggiensis TaxID=1268553 RepID=A0A7W7NRH4_9SPHN|nr:CPBP family intramembrane glutamic endopeptidase [Sphingomonas kyeonggiensis]MBB4837781.1 membrane protease YdiL (CAAX protease family) [Sphingomonas kyeonggiensis]